jgi:hypothetical protein
MDAFQGCLSLKSLHLPSRVALTSGQSLAGTAFENITVDKRNPSLRTWGTFLLNSVDLSVVEYWRTDDEAVIPSFVENLAHHSFSGSGVRQVTFDSVSRMSILGESAFSDCGSLNSICIPASVHSIASRCFLQCLGLSHVALQVVPG